jgi:hypothetical protein
VNARPQFAEDAEEIRVRRRRDAVPPDFARVLEGLQGRSEDEKAVREFRSARLGWQSAILEDHRLSLAERVLGHFIGTHVNMTTGLAYFGQKFAARRLGFSGTRTVERGVSRLIDVGWIWTVQPHRHQTLRYLLLLNNVELIKEQQIMIREALDDERETKP